MMQTFFSIYLASAVVTTVVVFFLSTRITDRHRPAPVRLALSVAAGLLWPLVVIGLIQFGSFVAYTKVEQSVDPEPLDHDVNA
jgi:nitrate/nitrite transporter NarK